MLVQTSVYQSRRPRAACHRVVGIRPRHAVGAGVTPDVAGSDFVAVGRAHVHVEAEHSAACSQVLHMLLPSPTQATASCPRDRSALLDEGEDVGQDLARVVFVGQAVDHRHARARRSARALSCSKVRIITMSTIREITRAVSSTGSPRPSWVSAGAGRSPSRPAGTCRPRTMTRVRVEAFSKIIASDCRPAAGRSAFPPRALPRRRPSGSGRGSPGRTGRRIREQVPLHASASPGRTPKGSRAPGRSRPSVTVRGGGTAGCSPPPR